MKFRIHTRRFIAAGCCLLALLLSLKSGRQTILALDKEHWLLESQMGQRLKERHGLLFQTTMDGAHPVDSASLRPLHVRKAVRTKGKVGDARRIDLDHDTFLRLDMGGKLPGSVATFAAWFRPSNTTRKQMLFNFRSDEEGFAMAIENGMLSLCIGTNVPSTVASCPFTGVSNCFTHVALTFSPSEVVVFQNGRESCRAKLEKPVTFPRKPLMYGRSTLWPFEGDIDELAVWGQTLEAGDVAIVARARHGIQHLYEPWLSARLAINSWLSRTVSPTYRVIDRLIPRKRQAAILAKDMPIFMIWPSKADDRHFKRSHAMSIRDGFRVKKAAEFRRIDAAFGDIVVPMDIALDDVYASGEPRRMAFVMRDTTRTVFKGSGLMRLYPPELHSVLHADAPSALPLSATFVRLFAGNEFQGLYALEPFDRVGGSWMAYGSHVGQATNSVGYRASSSVRDDPPPGPVRDAAFANVVSLVHSDVFFPWSRQEVFARTREREDVYRKEHFEVQESGFPKSILKDNLSPLYVTSDLNLEGGPNIRWTSSEPDIVSETGKVTRPKAGPPRPVILTPVDARLGPRKPLRVRVIPLQPPLQTLFLHVATPLDKYTRTDFSCLRVPAGGGKGEWLTGMAATGGGAHHRGNTSYTRGAKRSLSLKFDEPVALIDDQPPARHVLLFSGYGDPTRLRNRISFDAYRAAAGGRTPNGITAIDWAEVFINGEYFGVWELAHGVRDLFGVDEGILFKIRSQHPLLWTIPSPEMAEAISPPEARADSSLPLSEILKTVATASHEEFPVIAQKEFIFDSIVDFYLMLNFTQNFDGQVVNQYLARSSASGKWFVIPWDYDKTFFNADPQILENQLVIRFREEVPEFQMKCREKWKTLRAGPFSDEAVLSSIGALAERLAPYMEEEYRLKQPEGWDGDFLGAVDQLKEVVAGRLRVLDQRFN